MNYRSFAQLADRVLAWSRRLPLDLDLIVGVPRSGLLPANLLALYRNLPLTDVDGLLSGRQIATGRRFRGKSVERPREGPLRVLVVDDSVWGGTTMKEVRARVDAADLPYRVEYAAVYMLPGAEPYVDHFAEYLDLPRLFEWNILHTRRLDRFCMDIDGVLCRDPEPRANDDGPLYRSFLCDAEPIYLPSKPVGWLVTSRLEKYRAETEEWLARHGVQYNELVMLDLPDKAARRGAKLHGTFKAEVYIRTGAALFYESSLSQAVLIANTSLKPVLCVDTMQMIYPDSTPRDRFALPSTRTSTNVERLVARVRRRLAKAARSGMSTVTRGHSGSSR
jgi:orotate phosphoribosyltransferase